MPVADNISTQERFALLKSKIKSKVLQQPGSAADTMQTIPLSEDQFTATSSHPRSQRSRVSKFGLFYIFV